MRRLRAEREAPGNTRGPMGVATIGIARHVVGRPIVQMYQPNPSRIVDEYLSYLTVHPTNATFDGSICTTTCSRTEPAVDRVADSRPRRLREAARRHRSARLTDTERLERPALDASIRARLFDLEEVRPWDAIPSTTPTCWRPAWLARRCSTMRRWPSRPARPLEASPGASLPVRRRATASGSSRHLDQGRPRSMRGTPLHRRRSAARVRQPGRHAPARRSRRRLDRGGHGDRRIYRLPRARAAPRNRLVSTGAIASSRSYASTRASSSMPIDCWRLPRVSCSTRRMNSGAWPRASTAGIRSRRGRGRRTIIRRRGSSFPLRSSSSPTSSTSSTSSASSRARMAHRSR